VNVLERRGCATSATSFSIGGSTIDPSRSR
jgi:hypothetical protein